MKKLLFHSLPQSIEALVSFFQRIGLSLTEYLIEALSNLMVKVEGLLRYLFSSPLLITATIVAFNALTVVIFWMITTENSTLFETLRLLKKQRWNLLLWAGFLYFPINWCYNRMLYQTKNNRFTTRVITVLFSVVSLPVLLSSGGFHLFDMKSGIGILIALRLVLLWQELLKPRGAHLSVADFFKRIFAKKYTVIHHKKFL